MTNQEILDNAPEGATHVDINNHYWHNSTAFYWLCCDDGTTCAGDVGNNVRSLEDIRTIVEQAERIAELDKELVKPCKACASVKQKRSSI